VRPLAPGRHLCAPGHDEPRPRGGERGGDARSSSRPPDAEADGAVHGTDPWLRRHPRHAVVSGQDVRGRPGQALNKPGRPNTAEPPAPPPNTVAARPAGPHGRLRLTTP